MSVIHRKIKNHRSSWLASFWVILTMAAPPASIAAGSVAWQSWTFDHDVSGLYDGLSLSNVKFQGRTLIAKISLPVVRVFYDGDACGPYADRLGGTLSQIPWANNSLLAQREFTLDGRQWYEIGIRDQIGSYDMYQVYYLSDDGIIDAHFYSKGLQCITNHIHYPNWRIDFDLDGASNDQILRKRSTGFKVMRREFDVRAKSAINHEWRVLDSVTDLSVDIQPGFSNFAIPPGNGETEPVTAYRNNFVFGRKYEASEDTGWTYGPNTQVPYNDSEIINKQDLVFWYEAYLPHTADESSQLWHSTGVRIVANISGGTPPPPPPGSTNPAPITINDSGPAATYPSTVSITGATGVIGKVTVTLNSLSHTYPDDLDIALVGPGGQAVKLMSDAGGGGGGDVYGVSLTFDSTAAATLPNKSQISSGVFKPSNYGASDPFAAPAPGGNYGTDLNVFNGDTPNGTWKLFIMDDAGEDAGSVAGGWTLTITTL